MSKVSVRYHQPKVFKTIDGCACPDISYSSRQTGPGLLPIRSDRTRRYFQPDGHTRRDGQPLETLPGAAGLYLGRHRRRNAPSNFHFLSYVFRFLIFICILKIQLIFPAYALIAPNECDVNFIEIFGEKTDLRHRLRHFCGSKIDIVLSKSHILHLRLYAHHTALRSTFDAIFTAVTPYRETEGNSNV